MARQVDSSDHPETKSSKTAQLDSSSLRGVNICVIGGGFVGLVSAAGFAEFGHSVVCVDKDSDRVSALRNGKIPFYEKDLENLIKRNVERERLTFSDDLESAVKGQKVIFVAVGTPASENGRTDLSAMRAVAEGIGNVLEENQIVVLKSTVPIGTGDIFRSLLSQNGNEGKTFHVVNNPEFLREGSAVYDFFNPQRIVIGGENEDAVESVAHLYRLGMTRPVPIVTTNNETAEMIKYASNAFLATKIGFMNELAGLCDIVGINVLEVARAMGMDPRIGADFMNPGPGWGGSCLGKDLLEIKGLAESHNYTLIITDAILVANEKQHRLVVSKVKKLVSNLKDARIGVLGLAFKADTSDMRDSPAIPIIRELLLAGAEIVAYDPQAMVEAKKYLPDIKLVDSAYETADEADCLLILTEWQEFQLLDYTDIVSRMKKPNLVDSRNILAPELVERYGIRYESMGQS